MAGNSQTTTALLTEHFRYTPLTLLDEIINTVNELVYHAVNQLEKALSTAPTEVLGFELDESHEGLEPDSQQAALEEIRQNEVELGIVQIESLLNATVDKDFDKFEIYTLRNILAIGHDEDADLAQWVCLDHYRHLKVEPTDQQLTPEALQLQRRKLHETAKLNTMLREESTRNKKIIEQLEALTTGQAQDGPLAFLTSRNGQSLSKEMHIIVEQLPQIRAALAQLQASLSAPIARTGRSQQDVDVLKRRTYLDSQAVKALNRQGIEPEGCKVDTSFTQRITQESVQGLEALVRGLGPSDSPG